ncbi:uncharacterized protein PHACADRAFT_252572 [Phanerochaete carnosa HHB-10118-sp]|uniref:Uncharacterized protein n=1 Tax=Phanerochaete carnosa (strain HHB-10118-sp) TaxID=650164 RepID=K5X674_PHACS|nr:uncharacterized protein PHACADRAFT_252572 [Phanerochaete carnosa HHB-10118-sp]EKM58332.1 hypothetical protein PHACADRAFT_252572 [Phanerochaete carnosa HHB-10118-sp]
MSAQHFYKCSAKNPSTVGPRSLPAGYTHGVSTDTDFDVVAPLQDADLALGRCEASTVLADRLDNTILVTGLLLSPIHSATNWHEVADKPALRIIAYFACLLNACGLLTSVVYRLRLRALKTRNLDEQYAEEFCNSQIGSFISIMSPLVLSARYEISLPLNRRTEVLLSTQCAALLSGSLLLNVNTGGAFEAALSIPQLALFAVGVSFLIIHGRLVFRPSIL